MNSLFDKSDSSGAFKMDGLAPGRDVAVEDNPSADPLAITTDEYREIILEIEEQPLWRRIADKEMDYADGNQLDSDILAKQRELGIPPSVEDLISPTLLSIQGYEAITRTDWRVTPNGDPGGRDVADAINYKLNQAERESKADNACSDAFRPQIACGIGWVEVAKNSDPFEFPIRTESVHRNEIHWDMKSLKGDLTDARWLRRQRWLHPDRIADAFPDHRELIELMARHGSHFVDEDISGDGGTSTGLQNAWAEGRAWTTLEERWYNRTSKEICLAELWYRRWVTATVITMPDKRVVEYDNDNVAHNIAVMRGARVSKAQIAKVRRSYWIGEHMLFDSPSPYAHKYFPYVPFWGFQEDNTRVPYGYVRGMKYPQDSLNAGNSKLRWLLGSVRTTRTKGATEMTDEQVRRQIARPDADIILDAAHMAKPGARFEVERDGELTQQHHQMLIDNRQTIQSVSNVTNAFMGREGTARSGIQEQTQAEQSNQSLAKMMDNFKAGRTLVGEIIMSMLIVDMGNEEQTIIIEGDAVRQDRAVVINRVERDEAGYTYLSNDLQRTRLKVGLEDVPSSSTYRAQQLNSLTEAIKPLPQEYLAAAIPFLTSLMDVPFQRDLIEAFRAVGETPTQEQIQQQIDDAVKQALTAAGNEIKQRELDIKEAKAGSEIKKLDAHSLQMGVQAAFAAMQAGAQIAQFPMIAPVADKVMQSAGYKRPNPGGDDPNYPTAAEAAAVQIKDPWIQGDGRPEIMDVNQNTSPMNPPVPQSSSNGADGIETPTLTDNI